MKKEANDNVCVFGGLGEKKSNNGTQWYQQDRVYDPKGLSPALSTYKSDYWIIIEEPTIMIEVKLEKREDHPYPFLIRLGRDEMILTKQELLSLYEQITDIITDNEDLWE